jgi:hypothetical protein
MSRIPSAETFSKLSVGNQLAILEVLQREIQFEIDGLVSGYICVTDGRGRAYHLKNTRARMKRLEKLANSFGYWTEEAA